MQARKGKNDFGAFNREALPTWPNYADTIGAKLVGKGRWRTTACEFHGGSDSMRVNTQSGGWVCMSCGAKGGDVLAHYMQRTGAGFREAAIALGAWDHAGPARQGEFKPRTLSARDAMEAIARELLFLVIVLSDIRRGVIPTDADWLKFLHGAGRIEALAKEFRA